MIALASLRKRKWLLAAGASGVALLAGAAFVLGPGGPWIAGSLANGAQVWRLGTLNVEGVSGLGLGDLRVARATLRDDKGVWATVENLQLNWRPLRLLFGEVALVDASAAKFIVVRRPELAPPGDGGGGPIRFDTDVPALSIADLSLADGVAGPAARLTASGAVRIQRDMLKAFHLDAKRLDGDLDLVAIDYSAEDALELDASVEGAPGGVIANLLQTPDQRVSITAKAGGEPPSGAGELDARIGGNPFASGTLSWTGEGWRGAGELHLGAAPALASYAARFGPLLTVSASGDAPRATGAPFTAVLGGPLTSGEARGRLDADLRPVGAVTLRLQAQRLDALVPELGFDSGIARFEGAVEFEDSRTRLSGRLGVSQAPRSGVTVNAEGPVEVFLRQEDIRFTAQLAGGEIGAPEALRGLFLRTNIAVEGAYNRTSGDWTFPRIQMIGPNAGVTGAGKIDDSGSDFTGSWDLPQASVLLPGARGAARGRWRMVDTPATPTTLTADGAARQFGGFEPFGPLLGPTPTLDAQLRFTDEAILVDHARAQGPRLRLGARGRIVGERADLALEVSARGPARIAGVQFNGGGDATGSLTGDLGNPTINLKARFGTLDLNGAAFENVTADFNLAPEGRAHGGRLALEGTFAGLPARGEARLAVRGDAIAAEDLTAKLASMTATGRADVKDGVFTTALTLGGVMDGVAPGLTGALTGAFDFRADDKGGAMTLDADVAKAQFGAVAADHATFSLQGPLEAMAAKFSLTGWANVEPLSLTGEGQVSVGDAATFASLSASGRVDGADIASRGPINLRWANNSFVASGAADLGDGSVQASWRADRDTVSIDAVLEKTPLYALTVTMEQPLAGTIDGRLHLSGARKSLAGDADLTFTQARFARRSRDPIDGRITARLGDGMLRGTLEAHTPTGLTASVNAQIPVVAEAAPFQLVPVRGSVLEADWRVAGPVGGLWTLFGPMDQSLAGQVDGAGHARFAGGAVSGDGKLTLAGGSFDDKLTGAKLRAISAELLFDDAGMSLQRFEATDGANGRLVGSGRLNGQDNGKLSLTLRNMRLIDRPDARAMGNGDLALEWRPSGATLSGDIQILEAEVRVVDAGVAPPAEIEVVEINRPGPPRRAAAKPVAPISAKMDIHVTAPGRVFTRTRGLEAEWSMDMRVSGDVAAPLLFGEARLLRGDFNLGGRRFELEEGVIKFAGQPEQAEVDIVATATTTDLTARISITGSALDPKIELSSDPALPEDEVLPQLLFGRSARELTPLEGAQLAASLATLAGRSAFDIAGAARAAVALDRLEVRQEVGGVLVAGGKYLTREVYVEVSRNALGRTATSVEWQVRPRLFVISSFLANGDQRLAVRWRQDY